MELFGDRVGYRLWSYFISPFYLLDVCLNVLGRGEYEGVRGSSYIFFYYLCSLSLRACRCWAAQHVVASVWNAYSPAHRSAVRLNALLALPLVSEGSFECFLRL